jgi:hypothetical protein
MFTLAQRLHELFELLAAGLPAIALLVLVLLWLGSRRPSS